MSSDSDPQDREVSVSRRAQALGALVLVVAVALVAVFVFDPGENDPGPRAGAPLTTDSQNPLTTDFHGDPDRADQTGPPALRGFQWMATSLPSPEGQWVDIIGLTDTSEGLMAFGRATDPTATSPGEAKSLLVWESSNGADWKVAGDADGIPPEADLQQILFHDGSFTAVGMAPDPDNPRRAIPIVLRSGDGLSWSETEMTFSMSEGGDTWIEQATAGDEGILVAMNVNSGHIEPELVIEKDGKTLVANANDWTLAITSDAGVVLLEGTPEQIWSDGGESEFGLLIRDPETRDVLFTLSWDRFEGNPDEITDDGTRIYLMEGYRLAVEEFDGDYSVEDISTGETLFDGTMDELFRGPSPTFTNANGEVVMSLNWNEVDRAMEAAWREFAEGEEEYFSRPVVLHSSDGTSFTEVSIDIPANATEVHIGELVATDGGFIAFGESWSPVSGEPRQLVWKSADGAVWETFQPTGDLAWIHSVTVFDSRFLGIGEAHEGGSSVLTSTDGITWETVMETEQTDGYIWFSGLETGPLGVLIAGEVEGSFRGSGIYETESDGLLLTIEPGSLYLVDTESRQILMEGSIESLEDEGLLEIADDTITFFDEAGEILFEQDWYEVAEILEQSPDIEGEYGYEVRSKLWYSRDGRAFSTLQVDELNGVSVSRMLVGSEYVALAGDQWMVEDLPDSRTVTTEAAESASEYSLDFDLHEVSSPIVVVGVPSDR